MSTTLHFERHKTKFDTTSEISKKAAEGRGNTNMPSATAGRGGRRGEAGTGEEDETLVEEKDVGDDLGSDLSVMSPMAGPEGGMRWNELGRRKAFRYHTDLDRRNEDVL
jgi:hypothetical protein